MISTYKNLKERKMTKVNRKWTTILVMFLASSLLLLSCDPKNTKEVSEEVKVSVNSAGKLMEIMHEGKVRAQIALDTVNKVDLYGLGAIEGLKGELTVVNGVPYLASVDSMKAVVNINDSAKAALFVYAYVPQWDTVSLIGTANVAEMIEGELQKRSLAGPMPFQLLTAPNQLNYHIINFTGEKPTKSNHKQGALNDSIANEAVQIIGFYSTNSAGVYTHHGSKIHMHFLAGGNSLSGHIDSLNMVERPIKLLLPSL